ALMAHPLTRAGEERTGHRRYARAYERRVLRGRGIALPAEGAALPGWPDPPAATEEEAAARAAWLARLEADLAPLVEALRAARAGTCPLDRLVAAHRATAEALAGGDPETPGPWSAGDGAAVAGLLDELAAAAVGEGGAPGPAAYAALIDTVMRERSVRPAAERPHPRIAIRGTIEARTEMADLTILAGLNEGSWPGTADPGPWLSRPMRARLGLPPPEREVGLSAHDFLQGACREAVILTRSAQVEGTPQVAARWLTRLATLLEGTDPGALAAMRARGARYTDLVGALDRPPGAPDPSLAPAPRPAPRPAVDLRPRRLSVTRLETLIRDPYALYAERVLGLAPLEPLDAPPDARDRGEVLHETMRRFTEATAHALPQPAEAEALLMESLDAVLAGRRDPPDLVRLWRGRLARAAKDLLTLEARLRAHGRPMAQERRGAMTLPVPGREIVLTARADRLDLTPEGAVLAYDYKSGQPPGRGQVGRFAQQIHVAALIARAGGFEGLAAAPAAGGAYLGIASGRETAVEAGFAEALDEHAARLAALFARYEDPDTPYVSRLMVEKEAEALDYDHLARRGEWEGQ
ncbi:MAG: PD-(D/E)XK nuclease family protein, partial [Pseudomonadota bacterium]